MRRRRLRRYIERLQKLQGQALKRDDMLMNVGAARHAAGRDARLVQVTIPQGNPKAAKVSAKEPKADATKIDRPELARLLFKLDRAKLRC